MTFQIVCSSDAMKTNSCLAVKPSQGMDMSAKMMTQQSTIQLAQKKDAMYNATNSTSFWLNTRKAPDLMGLAEAILQHQLLKLSYVGARVDQHKFLVCRKVECGWYVPPDMEAEMEAAA